MVVILSVWAKSMLWSEDRGGSRLGGRGTLPRCKGQCHLRGNRREVRMFSTATGPPPPAGATAPEETADANKPTVNGVATVIEPYLAENARQGLNDFADQQYNEGQDKRRIE
jgi:hypothetical protein